MLSTELYAIILYQFQVLCGKSVESHKEHGQLPQALRTNCIDCEWVQQMATTLAGQLQSGLRHMSIFMCTYCISLLTDNGDRKEDNVMIEFAIRILDCISLPNIYNLLISTIDMHLNLFYSMLPVQSY